MKDLALLVADKNMDFALRGLLGRPKALGIRMMEYEVLTHVNRDGGVRATGPETLALLRGQFNHGILMLDWEGSGSNLSGALGLEHELDTRLALHWGNRAKSIVIEPELDAWIWGSDNVLAQIVGWSKTQGIRDWLRAQEFQFDQNEKPFRPKETLEALLWELNLPRSSARYKMITGKIALRRCIDPAFRRLKDALQSWFPTL